MNFFSQKFLTSAVGLIALLAVIIIVNFVAANLYFRWDITEAKTYSLTDGTKKMLSDLDQDVTLKLFYSSSLRGQPSQIKAFAGRVKDLLATTVKEESLSRVLMHPCLSDITVILSMLFSTLLTLHRQERTFTVSVTRAA